MIDDVRSVYNRAVITNAQSDAQHWWQEIWDYFHYVSEMHLENAYRYNFSFGYILENRETYDLDVGCYSDDDDDDGDDEATKQQHGVDSVVEFYEHPATTLEYYFRKYNHLNYVIPSSVPQIRINNKIHKNVIKILRDQYANNAYCEILSDRWDDECENEFNQLLQLPNHM